MAIASILALKPRVLVLDEPTGELDPRSSRRVFTLLKELNEEQGITVILDIEVQGAAQVKAAMPEAVTVFLAPPSLEVLEQRLRGRGTETEEKIRSRLETARQELLLAPTYDFTVINDDAERAAREIRDILELPVKE